MTYYYKTHKRRALRAKTFREDSLKAPVPLVARVYFRHNGNLHQYTMNAFGGFADGSYAKETEELLLSMIKIVGPNVYFLQECRKPYST